MNVLFLIGKYPNYGGTEVVTTLLTNAFVKRNYNVSIASFEQPVPALSSELDPKAKLYELSFPAFSLKNIKALSSIVTKDKINVILNQWCLPFYTTTLCLLAANKANCKIISVLHGVPDKNKRLVIIHSKIHSTKTNFSKLINQFWFRILFGITGLNLRYVYRKSDRFVVLSKSFMTSFKLITRIRNDSKLICIGNPLTINSDKYEYNPVKKNKTILYVGRMDYANKRVHRIIDAWEQLFMKYPEWNLVLVGDGPEKKGLIKSVAENKILNVSFKDFQKEPPTEYYKKASILMLTSELEGFGLVILEGMSFGVVPIVYGSYSAVYDIVEDDISGYIIRPPYTKDKMVSKVASLIEDSEKLNIMAKHSISRSEAFDPEVIVDNWQKLFAEL